MADEGTTHDSDQATASAAPLKPAVASTVAEGPTQGLVPEAQRALREAEERRRALDQNETRRQPEVGGRDGPEPVRYGDWEKDGLISDF